MGRSFSYRRGSVLAQVVAHRLQRIACLRPTVAPLGNAPHNILGRLDKDQNYALLTEIHLLEGDVGQALATLKQIRTGLWVWGTGELTLRVAQSAERTHTRDAIRLYSEIIQRLIKQQGRSNYIDAATHLRRIHDMYERMGEQSEWRQLIANLRTEHKRLPALQQELTKAGL